MWVHKSVPLWQKLPGCRCLHDGALKIWLASSAKSNEARRKRAVPGVVRPAWASSIGWKSRTAKVAVAVAESKGVHREVESEGSLWQTSGPRTTNLR